jgi:hypothetical protein
MVRKQVSIEAWQDDLLKRRARELGLTESELIRRGIANVGYQPAPAQRDEDAWQELFGAIEERARSLPASEPGEMPAWSRERTYV